MDFTSFSRLRRRWRRIVLLLFIVWSWLLLAYGGCIISQTLNHNLGKKTAEDHIHLTDSSRGTRKATAMPKDESVHQEVNTQHFRLIESARSLDKEIKSTPSLDTEIKSTLSLDKELQESYLQRLKGLNVKRGHLQNNSCPNDENHRGYPCRDTNCTARFPPPHQRLHTVIQLQYRVNDEYWWLIGNLTNSTRRSTNLVFITAASVNHYNESQGLLRSLYNSVFPFLDKYTQLSYRVVYYDLGLSAQQLAQIRRHSVSSLEVIRFPFESLPPIFKKLGTCIWKPLLVKAHLNHSNVTFWMDASARFKSPNISAILNHVTTLGLVITRTYWKLPSHVAQPMFDYFHTKPCLVSAFYEFAGGFLGFKNDPLIIKAVVNPWVSCAFSPNCLCPGKDCTKLFGCNNDGKYSKCHRFDQSAIALILTSLFDWRATNFVLSDPVIEFKRGENIEYLPKKI